MAEHDDGACDGCADEPLILLSRSVAEQVLAHLKRAGHDRLGQAHKVYPEPGTWSIEYDILPCDFGLLPPNVRRRSFSAKEDERIDAASIKECTCGYNAALAFLTETTNEKAYDCGLDEACLDTNGNVKNGDHPHHTDL